MSSFSLTLLQSWTTRVMAVWTLPAGVSWWHHLSLPLFLNTCAPRGGDNAAAVERAAVLPHLSSSEWSTAAPTDALLAPNRARAVATRHGLGHVSVPRRPCHPSKHRSTWPLLHPSLTPWTPRHRLPCSTAPIKPVEHLWGQSSRLAFSTEALPSRSPLCL